MSRPKAPRNRKRAGSRVAGRRAQAGHLPHLRDGGAWSLAGYTYQMLASAVERVKLEDLADASEPGRSVRFLLEQHGQDAAVTDSDGVRLIQFKYSQSERPIKPAELAEILLALEESSRRVPGKPAVRWRLVTNRQLSPTSKRLHDTSKGVGGPRTRGRAYGAKRSNGEVIARLGSNLDVVPYDCAELESLLRNAAAKFGVDDEGVAGRVVDLLYKVAAKGPSRREVSLPTLNQALAEYPNPKSIRLRDCRDDMRDALTSAVHGQRGIALGDAVERRGLQTLLSERAAIAIVHGPGGCGKTIALFRALDQRLSDSIGPAGMIVERPRTLEHILGAWRNARPTGGAPVEALRQLRVANPEVGRPVLVLGLDGLDELSEPERAEAEALIRHFYAMHLELHRSQTSPDGLLIVTCRSRDDLDRVIAPRGTGGLPSPEVPSFDVGEFTDEELAAVWALWFPNEVVPRLGLSDEMRATVADIGGGGADGRLLALRHPVLLGCTKSLTVEQRQQLYEGDAAVWSRVLSDYFDWFTHKAVVRAGCSRKKVLGVLKAAARATVAIPLGTCDREADWVTPAITETGQAADLVRQIFDDAVTAGVVIAGPNKYAQPIRLPIEWRWRFPELATHLASLA